MDIPCCFGFSVRSRCLFKFARRGGGEDTLEIREATSAITAPECTALVEWTLPERTGQARARLYGADGIFQLWTNDAGWFRIDPAARIIEISEHDDVVRREQRLWGVPTALCFMHRGEFSLHAAAVDAGGAAILLAAPGRYGKTTLALAFHRNGHRLLTEDTTCCRLSDRPLLLPGPTSIRLRPDIFNGTAPAGTRLVSVTSDRVHLTVDPDQARIDGPVPIKALVFLREPSDRIRLERVEASRALADLWALNFRLRNRSDRSRSFSQLAQLAGAISIWDLHRPFRLENLDEVVARVLDACA